MLIFTCIDSVRLHVENCALPRRSRRTSVHNQPFNGKQENQQGLHESIKRYKSVCPARLFPDDAEEDLNSPQSSLTKSKPTPRDGTRRQQSRKAHATCTALLTSYRNLR